MNTGKQIEAYRNNLVELTNFCQLSIGTAYYVVKDFLRDLEKSYINSMAVEEEEEKVQAEKKGSIEGEIINSEIPTGGEPVFEEVKLS